MPNLTPEAALTTPAGPKTDQVTETRRVLQEMSDKADRAIDDQVARSDADDAEEVVAAERPSAQGYRTIRT